MNKSKDITAQVIYASEAKWKRQNMREIRFVSRLESPKKFARLN